MSFERIAPDVLAQQANLTGAITDIDDDPDSPDGLWLAWDGSGNTICRGSLFTPTGNPTTGAGKQEFRVLIRNSTTGSNSTEWSLQLYENNSLLSVLATGSDPVEFGEVISGTWDAALLVTADGSLVEIRLQQTVGATGNPGNQKGIEVGAMEWNVEYDVGAGEDVLLADDIESASEVTAPAIGQAHVLLADDVESASEVGAPALGQAHVLLAGDIESASELTTPAVSESNALLAGDIESASEISIPSMGQVHAILANDIESASELSAPAVSQKHALTAVSIESASEVSAPTVVEGGAIALLADDIESASEISIPSMGQVHAILANDIESSFELTTPSMGQEHALIAQPVESISEVSIPTVDRTDEVERGDHYSYGLGFGGLSR